MSNEKADVQKVYTIVHTFADETKAAFPQPEGIVTYVDLGKAQEELERLVEKEKEEMHFPFDLELYQEEYGAYYWEAYCDGYAPSWFTRFEIIESMFR